MILIHKLNIQEQLKQKDTKPKDQFKKTILYGFIGIMIVGLALYFKDDIANFFNELTSSQV